MKPLLVALLITIAVTSGAWAKGRHDPPREKPGPTIPVPVPTDRDVQGTVRIAVTWWIAWAGYLERGPFASQAECAVARGRYPQRYACVPVRD